MSESLRGKAVSCGDEKESDALPADLALKRILDSIEPLGCEDMEWVGLLDGLDRILSENLIAPIDVPGHDNSAMDGYAFSNSDLPDAGERELSVIGVSLAGHPFFGVCRPGECVRIMTGAILPAGTDTVIPQERVEQIEVSRIKMGDRVGTGDNVRRAGEDIRRGQTVLRAGRRLTAADLGLIASLGITELPVMRPLTIGYFSTGDELRTPGEPLEAGQIYDSNRYSLFGMLSRQPCEITDMGVVEDDSDALRTVLQNAAEEFDVVITSGGVSVGDADCVRQVLEEVGDIVFWKVALRPGRPLIFGRLGRAVFFGLPGNPVAVMVTFSQFVRPALMRLAGEIFDPPLMLPAVSASVLRKRPGRTEYQRGIVSQSPDGSLSVCKTGPQGSGILTSMSQANCFIVLPPEQSHVDPGSIVMVQLFAGLF